MIRTVHRRRYPFATIAMRVLLVLVALSVEAAPTFDALTPDQLEAYARARDRQYSHEDALEFAARPVPKSVEDLTPEQREDYQNARDRGGLSHDDAFDYATQPPPPPQRAEDAERPLSELDAEHAAHRAAADAARRRAADVRGSSGAGGECGHDIPAVLAQLDQYTRTGNTAAHSALWSSLPPEVQRQVGELQAARDAAEHAWFEATGLARTDWGFAWAAETAALLNTASQATPTRPSLVQQGEEFYGPRIADLEARQQRLAADIEAAERYAQTVAYNRTSYLEGLSWYVRTFDRTADHRDTFLDEEYKATTARIAKLTEEYTLVATELENTRRAAQSFRDRALIADTKANAEARAAEETRRFEEAFDASQAIRQQNAEIRTGELAFRDARENIERGIAEARATGADEAAARLATDLHYLTLVESDWLAIQNRIGQALQTDFDNVLARNAADGLGPASARDLANAITVRGLYPTLDPTRLAQVQARVASFAGGVQNNRASLGWGDVLSTFSESIDEAFVMPWELVSDPVDSIRGNLRFWRRYASFWYGVGLAAKDGVTDIAVLGWESLDTQLEAYQAQFNLVFGTKIDWFGNENLQFIANTLTDLSADKVAEVTTEIARQIDRRIAQNAAAGETGIQNMLSDTGYVVGTVTGAEEAAVRAVVIMTRYGKVIVKGAKIDELLDGAAAARAADAGSLTRADDAVLPLPESPRNLFGGTPGDIPPTLPPGVPRPSPPVAGPGLINAPGGQVRIHRTGDANPADEILVLRAGGHKVTLGPGDGRFIGGGSTSRAYASPTYPNTVIKITQAAGEAGIHLDNYGYRVLEQTAQSGALDPTKLKFPTIYRQMPIEGGGVVTIVERGPETAAMVRLRNGGQFNDAMVRAVQDGVEELARNGIVFPDFKLDNFGLEALPNGQYRMWLLDTGSAMRAQTPDVARRFYSDILSPPPAVVQRVESLPASAYMQTLGELATNASRQTIGEARMLLAKALQQQPTYFDVPSFPATPAGELAGRAFRWTRTDAHKTWLASQYDDLLDFSHFQQGTGLSVSTLGPTGLTYNPAVARQSAELRGVFGATPGGPSANLIGSSDSSLSLPGFRLGSDVSGLSGRPLQFQAGLPGWNRPFSPGGGARVAGEGADLMLHVPYRWSDDLLNDIELKPFIQRRFVIGGARLLRFGCEWPTLLTLKVPQAQQTAVRDRIAMLPVVTLLEDDPIRTEQLIDDPLYREDAPWTQRALRRVGLTEPVLTEIVRRQPRGEGIVVAVIDTGVAWGHRDLDPRKLWINRREIPANGVDDDGNGYVDDVVGWNFIDDNNLPWDTDGHGTMVAGIVAAETANGVGIAGIAPHARIMVLRALDAEGRGRASHTAQAIAYAVDNGAHIVNLSLGGRGLSRAETIAVEYANRRGVLVVAAAGNDGIELTDWGPASAAGVLVVGAVDNDDGRVNASNWGHRVDLVAPGTEVVSLRAPGTDLMAKFDHAAPLSHVVGEDGAYYRASGTSFAAPIVTGVAALLAERHPGRSAKDFRRILLNSARDVGTAGIDLTSGRGRLDAPAALAADPSFNIDAAIDGVRVSRAERGQVLEVLGKADADRLAGATLSIGAGENPTTWQPVAAITTPARGVLAEVPATAFASSPRWTLRLAVRHASGRELETRFDLKLE